MSSESRSFHVSAELVSLLRDHFRCETDVTYSNQEIAGALDTWLDSQFERMIEGIAEVITTPHLAESQHFLEILESAHQESHSALADLATDTVQDAAPATVFNGFRAFSPAKLGAMIEYIARSGSDIYKTNLNKLLFYTDLTFFYLHRRGISGATYLNLPFGPVPDTVENILNDLEANDRIRRVGVAGKSANAQMIKPGGSNAADISLLSEDEIRTLDWVIAQYGQLSPSEISELSHREKAYSSTRPNEPIAYEYAKFLQTLPERLMNQ